MAQEIGPQFAKLPFSTKIMVGGMVLLLTSLAYYSALHSPLDDDLEGARQTQSRLHRELSEAQKLKREFLQLREELEARKTVDQENLRVLPESAEIASVLQDLNRLAELSGLDIQAVRPRPESSEEFYVRIPVSLMVAGRYHQLSKFFYNVSRLQRAINIEDIRIEVADTKGRTQDDEVILKVEVMATTFRRRTKEAS